MKSIRFHHKARREYAEAILYHQDQTSDLDQAFQAELESYAARIAHHPDRWAPIGPSSIRKCSLKRFPYEIIYLDQPKFVFIVAVANQKRRPFYWQDRI